VEHLPVELRVTNQGSGDSGGDIYNAVNGGKGGGNPSEFAPSPGGRNRYARVYTGARPGRNAQFLRFHGARLRGGLHEQG
jgi:hypothetical protein